jgi:hypothetical protein
MVSGNQIGPHHRAHLSIPPAEKNESLHGLPTGESRAYCELEVPRPYSLTGRALLFICRPKTTAVATTEEPVQGIDEFPRP